MLNFCRFFVNPVDGNFGWEGGGEEKWLYSNVCILGKACAVKRK